MEMFGDPADDSSDQEDKPGPRDRRREEEPADVESITINSPMTKLDSHRLSDRLSAAKKKSPSPLIIRPKKSTQILKTNESDDSSVPEQRMRSAAKPPVHSANNLERRGENTQESNFLPFAFPRRDEQSSDAHPAHDKSDENGRKIEVPVTQFDLRAPFPDKSPTTKAPESCQKIENRTPGKFNLTLANQKPNLSVESRRDSLAPHDALTPANSAQKKDFSRKSVHALAVQNAANSHHSRHHSRSQSKHKHDHEHIDNSVLSVGSGKSGKPDSIRDPLVSETNNHNLIQRGSSRAIPQPPKTARKPPESVRRKSANLSQHQQSEDSSLNKSRET